MVNNIFRLKVFCRFADLVYPGKSERIRQLSFWLLAKTCPYIVLYKDFYHEIYSQKFKGDAKGGGTYRECLARHGSWAESAVLKEIFKKKLFKT